MAETPNRAHAPGPQGSQRTTATAQRAEEGEEEGNEAPSPSTPTTSPPAPGGLPHSQGHTTDSRCTPSVSDHHTRPRRAGMPASEDTATSLLWAKPGTQPTLRQAHWSGGPRWGRGGGRSQELPLVHHATVATDRRRQNGQRIGTTAVLGVRHTRAQPQEAADGKQTEVDRQTERGTDRVQPHEANTTEWGRCWWGGHAPPRGAWLKATHRGAGGSTSQPPGPTTGCHH